MTLTDDQIAAIDEERIRLREALLQHESSRPDSTARGVHHLALLCSDVERTIRFYQDVLECAAFVNQRKLRAGEPPVLLLSFHRKPPA